MHLFLWFLIIDRKKKICIIEINVFLRGIFMEEKNLNKVDTTIELRGKNSEEEITLDTKIQELNLEGCRFSYALLNKTIGEVLNYDLDPNSSNSLYQIRTVGKKQVETIKNILHSYGFIFECEKEKITEETKIGELAEADSLPIVLHDVKIWDVLNRKIDPTWKNNLQDYYNLTEEDTKKLIDIIHSYGFTFEFEKKITEESIIYDLPNSYEVRWALGREKIGDVLQMDLDSTSPNSIYHIRSIGKKQVDYVVELLHKNGFVFECEKKVTRNTPFHRLGKMSGIHDSFKNKTVGEILAMDLEPNTHNSIYGYKSVGQKQVDGIVDLIHSRGFSFECENKPHLSKQLSIMLLSNFLEDYVVYILKDRGIDTIDDLLSLSISIPNNTNEKNLYNINRNELNFPTCERLIERLHLLDLYFYCENEDNKNKPLTKEDSVWRLMLPMNLIKYLKKNGIHTIGEVLLLSTNQTYLSGRFLTLDQVLNLNDEEKQKFIDYIHSLGFFFVNEASIMRSDHVGSNTQTLEDRMSILENIFSGLDAEFVYPSFYNAIENPSDIYQNKFVIYFVNKVNEEVAIPSEVIIRFLIDKLVEHKKKLRDISNRVNEGLVLKKK